MTNMGAVPGHFIERGGAPQKNKLPLPLEILELIFWHMDESTFFISLWTCRQFVEAGSTRKNLLHQVHRLPGLRPGLGDLCNEDLRSECCRRASRSGCMAWILANIRRCDLPSGTMLSRSVFSTDTYFKACWNRSEDFQLALANRNGTITIYSLANEDVRPTLTLDLPNLYGRVHSPEISTLAFSQKGDLVVLHEPGKNVCDHDNKENYHYNIPDPGLPCTCRTRKTYELTTFYRCKNKARDSVSCQKDCRRSRVLALEGAKPIGIALASTGNVSIAWEVRNQKEGHCYRIDLIRTSKKPAEDVISVSGNVQDNCDKRCEFHTSSFKYYFSYLSAQPLFARFHVEKSDLDVLAFCIDYFVTAAFPRKLHAKFS